MLYYIYIALWIVYVFVFCFVINSAMFTCWSRRLEIPYLIKVIIPCSNTITLYMWCFRWLGTWTTWGQRSRSNTEWYTWWRVEGKQQTWLRHWENLSRNTVWRKMDEQPKVIPRGEENGNGRPRGAGERSYEFFFRENCNYIICIVCPGMELW